LTSEAERNKIRNNDFGESNDPSATDTLYTATDKENGEIIGQGSDEGSDEEENDGGDDHRLAAEDVREGSEIWLEDRGAKQEAGSCPEGLDGISVKLLRNDL
jgi:hypothetical protein